MAGEETMVTKVERIEIEAVLARAVALYEELALVTAVFWEAIEDEAPEEAMQTFFMESRTDLVERLQPLLALEERWLAEADEETQVERRQALAPQLQKMELLTDLDARISTRLAVLRTRIGEEIKSLTLGRKGLVGYRVGLKVAPRFCQIAA